MSEIQNFIAIIVGEFLSFLVLMRLLKGGAK